MATTVANILSGVAARLGGISSITASTNPSQSDCIQWINEASEIIVQLCAENNSEIGRTTGTITTVDGTAAYTDFAADMYVPANYGWVLKTNSRDRIELTTEEESLAYDPSTEGEPEKFYLTGANAVTFLPTPDDAYSVMIPYWKKPTALTLTTSTIPFNGIYDNLFIDMVVLRAQNREEYDLGFELKWQQFIMERCRRIIVLRKNNTVRVEL